MPIFFYFLRTGCHFPWQALSVSGHTMSHMRLASMCHSSIPYANYPSWPVADRRPRSKLDNRLQLFFLCAQSCSSSKFHIGTDLGIEVSLYYRATGSDDGLPYLI